MKHCRFSFMQAKNTRILITNYKNVGILDGQQLQKQSSSPRIQQPMNQLMLWQQNHGRTPNGSNYCEVHQIQQIFEATRFFFVPRGYQTGYDQYGMLLGQVFLEEEAVPLVLRLSGCRKRTWGPSKVRSLHRTLTLFGTQSNGTMFVINVKSYINGCKE